MALSMVAFSIIPAVVEVAAGSVIDE